MKHLHKYSDYEIVNQYIKLVNEAKSIDELNKIEEELKTLNLDEGLYDFVKRQTSKVKAFFTDAGKAVDFLLMGDDEEEEEEEIDYNREILLQYNEPKGYDDMDVYKIYNGTDATDHKFNFQDVFYTYTQRQNLVGNLKDTPSVRVAKKNNDQTENKTEYVIALYSLLNELEVDTELYQKGGEIEAVTPSIFIYLKHVKETFEEGSNFNAEFKKFETQLRKNYKQLLKLPKFYDKKTYAEFGEKVLIKALNSVKIDMKRN